MHALDCTIQWQDDNSQDIDDDFVSIKRSNILQSAPYARAICAHMSQKTRVGYIYINGDKGGMVRIYEVGFLWNSIHALILDRGPLWFDGYGGAAHVKAFFEAFNHQFPKRFGRKRRILPEIEEGAAIQKILNVAGYERLSRDGYQTIWLDINKDADELKASMRKNWRGSLNKAARCDLKITWDDKGRYLSWIMKCYASDKSMREYNGPDPAFLEKVARAFLAQGQCFIGVAEKEGRKIAAIMLFKHGVSATYQCGWTTQIGRENNANHLLLWDAVLMLQKNGVIDFDLGGTNDQTAKGVKEFKQGLGGKDIRLVGHYI